MKQRMQTDGSEGKHHFIGLPLFQIWALSVLIAFGFLCLDVTASSRTLYPLYTYEVWEHSPWIGDPSYHDDHGRFGVGKWMDAGGNANTRAWMCFNVGVLDVPDMIGSKINAATLTCYRVYADGYCTVNIADSYEWGADAYTILNYEYLGDFPLLETWNIGNDTGWKKKTLGTQTKDSLQKHLRSYRTTTKWGLGFRTSDTVAEFLGYDAGALMPYLDVTYTPCIVQNTSASTDRKDMIYISWNAPPEGTAPVLKYRVFREKYGTSTYEEIDDTTDLYYEDKTCDPETTYYYYVICQISTDLPTPRGEVVDGYRLKPDTLDSWDRGDDTSDGATFLAAPTFDAQSHGPHSLSRYSQDNEDWFKMSLVGGATYEFESTSDEPVDTILYVYNDEMGVAAHADDGDNGTHNFKLTGFEPDGDGVQLHYFKIEARFADKKGGGIICEDPAEYSFKYRKLTDPTYTVSYDANGATSGTAPASQTKVHDVALTLAGNSGNLAKAGSNFAGWNTSANGSGTDYAAGGSYTLNASIKLYAKWTTVPTYTVSYDANGATSGTAPGPQTKTHGVALTLAINSGNLAQTGYAFAGWNTAANGFGADYAAGGSYTDDATVTLYAKWTAGAPIKAANPSPADGAGNQDRNVDLSWENGGGATSYNVIFNGQSHGNRQGTTFDPGPLDYGTTYQWRIDAVNGAGTTTGDPWSFTTEQEATGEAFPGRMGSLRILSSGPTRFLDIQPNGLVVWSNTTPGSSGRIQVSSTVVPGWTDIHTFSSAEQVMNTQLAGGEDAVPAGMVLIPGGTNAGSNPLAADESYWDLYPATYSLTVTSFDMDKYEVTKALWDEVYIWAIAHGYSFDNAGSGKATNHPIHTVNWYDCVKWCNARSQKEGRQPVYTVNGAVYKGGQSNDVVQTAAAGYRLPTAVEWEYAARGGAASRRFPWGDADTIQHARANYNSTSSDSYDTSPTPGYHPTYNDGNTPYTSPAGSLAANGYGLHDMAGNVWEWCFDWRPGYVGSYRVFRGGSWYYEAYFCRVGDRVSGRPDSAGNDIGFRVVLSLGQP